jgi:DUF917 family protein
MKTTLATRQDCEDFVRGLTFLGTGGGGAPERGLNLLLEKHDAGATLGWVSVDDLPPDTWTATVAGLGGRPPKDGPPVRDMEQLGLMTSRHDNTLPVALNELAAYVGVNIGAIVPGEVGAGNSTVPLITAATLGLQTIDGDYAGGRSIPELSQISPEVLGRSIFPVTMADRWGDITILKSGAGAQMADRIGRMLAAAAYGGVAFACLLMQAKEARALMNHGSMTQALQIGRILRQAREQGGDPAAAVVTQHDGWVLFRSEVAASEVDDKEAYMFGYGTHHLKGVDEFAGHTFRIWYKNEFHISWLDDQPFVTSPDAIAVIDLASGEPYVNDSIKPGRRVAVVGRKAPDAYRSARGVEVLGPRHFGFEMEYVPIEQRVR